MMASHVSQFQGALRPPPGVEPNFTDPPNLHTTTLVLLAIFTTITTVCVFIRSYTKFFIIKQGEWEDYLFIIVWAGFIAFMIKVSLEVPYGSGVHQWNVLIETIPAFAQHANAADIYYNFLVLFLKLAILLQYLHIFAPTKSQTYWMLWLAIAATAIFYVFCILFRIFACVPRKKIWDPLIPGVCADSSTALVVTAVFNAVSDFVVLCIPTRRIWRLQMAFHKKIGVSAVFATGLFGCVSSIMRIVTSLRLIRTGDQTYYILVVGFWGMAEITSGIFCGCLIVFPRFYRSTVSPYTTAIFSVFRSRFSHYQIYDSGSNSSKRKSPRNWYHQPLQRDLAETNELRGLKPTYIPEYICEVSTEYNLHPREPSVPITGNELSSSIEQVSTS